VKTSQLGVAALVAAGLVASSFAGAAQAADQLLNGTIPSASGENVGGGTLECAWGEKLGGVTVSAKAQGTTITTSVYTDDKGDYYFPPLPAGKYNVWAQALAFETAKGEVDLTAARRADLTLEPITDAERRVRQLPGELLMAALPEANDEDARIKRVFRNACTGCHTPSYVLQFR